MNQNPVGNAIPTEKQSIRRECHVDQPTLPFRIEPMNLDDLLSRTEEAIEMAMAKKPNFVSLPLEVELGSVVARIRLGRLVPIAGVSLFARRPLEHRRIKNFGQQSRRSQIDLVVSLRHFRDRSYQGEVVSLYRRQVSVGLTTASSSFDFIKRGVSEIHCYVVGTNPDRSAVGKSVNNGLKKFGNLRRDSHNRHYSLVGTATHQTRLTRSG